MWKKCNVFRHFSGPVYPQYMILGSMDIYERIPFAWYTRIYVNLNFRRLPYMALLWKIQFVFAIVVFAVRHNSVLLL